MVSLWNMVPQDVVMPTRLDGLERGMDKFMEDRLRAACWGDGKRGIGLGYLFFSSNVPLAMCHKGGRKA